MKSFEDETGAITIEYAICMPIVVFFIGLIFFAVNWFGMQSLCLQVVDTAMREGIVLEADDKSKEQILKYVELRIGDKMKNVDLQITYNDDVGSSVNSSTTKLIKVDAIYKMPDNFFTKLFSSISSDVKVSRVSRLER